MGRLKMHEAWHDRIHAQCYDCWYNLSNSGLRKTYESFNEIRLFRRFKPVISGRKFLEVGCATGELYRYISHYHKDIEYFGIDISEPAIERAKEKYPLGKFFVSDEGRPVSEIVKGLGIKASILFARDVVIHQTNPFQFLQDLISIPSELAILRIRTRDRGATVLDPELSCQWYCGRWVPYMVLNMDEVVDAIKAKISFEEMYILKNHMELGGVHKRYLPKDCYHPETGTAETAICIRLATKQVSTPKIVVEEGKDSDAHLGLFDRNLSWFFKRVKERLIGV